MTTPVADAFRRLCRMAANGDLDQLCERHALDLLVVHGSVLEPDADPADLDVAVWPRPAHAFELSDFIVELSAVVRTDAVDVMDLSRAGVVARGLALGRCEPLYERVEGLFARRQMAALPPLADTVWIRDLGLQTMAGR
jgi:hypothetical protein